MRVFRDKAGENHLSLERYKYYALVEDSQISPDGQWIAYTHVSFDDDECWQNEVRLIDVNTQKTRIIARGSTPRWSLDGSSFLYLALDDNGATQLFVYDLKSDSSRQLATLLYEPMFPAWSPNSQYSAFCMFVPEPRDWMIELPEAAPGITRSAEPFITEDLHYKQEPIGLVEAGYEHLFLLEVSTGNVQQLTSGKFRVLARESGRNNMVSDGLCWSPDGQTIFFDGNLREDADRRHLESHIYSLNIKCGEITQLTPTSERTIGAWYSPKVSPDGKSLAFLGYSWQKKHHPLSQYVWSLELGTGELKNLTPALDSVPTNLHWQENNKGVYFNAPFRGYKRLYQVSLEGKVSIIHEHNNECFELSSMARDGTMVGVVCSNHCPGDVAIIQPTSEEFKKVSNVNKKLLDNVRLGQVERLEYTSSDGTAITGWLIYPPGFDADKCYPLIVRPDAATPIFNYELQHYAANGYIVFTCHYRLNQASIGFGEAYTNDGVTSFPNERIYQDILYGVDKVLGYGYVNSERLFVVGSSQGGTVIAGLVGHTQRFRAAAILRPGWINKISHDLTTDETLWSASIYKKPFWEDPKPYLEHSPLMQVHKVTTPTLLMTGENDWRTPINQTEQFYAALKLVGKAPCRLIRIPGVNHGWGNDVATFARLQLYVLEWFDKQDTKGKSK